MNYTQTSAVQIFQRKTNCQLIIVGKDQQGDAFCYENQFQITESKPSQIQVSLTMDEANPLRALRSIEFVELSIRDRGVPYFAFVTVLGIEQSKQVFTLTLEVPDYLNSNENRKFIRIDFPKTLPITCSIVGVRGKSTHEGVPFDAALIDVCGGGLSFLTNKRLFFPLFLKIRVALPGFTTPFEVFGDIARISPYRQQAYRIAVEFRDVDEALVSRIDAYCRQHSEKELL